MATLHLVPHTHWDREWYQPFQHFRLRLVHLIDLLLEILEKNDRYHHFTLDGQTILLDDYLEVRPEEKDRLVEHIQSGKILIGPWYILPDEFLVSPEALIRNLLIGSATCTQFGPRMDVGYLPDPFGHIGQMPQILRGFDIQRTALRRGLSDEPCELIWAAPDGSKILLSYLRDSYDNAARLPLDPQEFARAILDRRKSLDPHCSTSHRLLLNGSDHHEPQAEIPALLTSLDTHEDQGLISSMPKYFDAVQREVDAGEMQLPLVHGELRDPKRHHLLPGVLSSRAWIKIRNHECENILERLAEPFSAWASLIVPDVQDHMVWTGHLTAPRLQRPEELLRRAWRLLLQCQPHDSICGCSIDQVHEEMRTRFDQSEQIAQEITRQSLAALAGSVDSQPLAQGGSLSALVVFNPTFSRRSGRAKAELELPAGLDPFEITDESGNEIPYRLLKREVRSLTDVEIDSEGLRGMMDLVKDGRALGLAVQDVAVLTQPEKAMVDIILAEGAEPNHEAVNQGWRQINELLDSGTHEQFRLRARFATQASVELLAADIPAHGIRTFGLRPSSTPPTARTALEGRRIENESLTLEVQEDGTLNLTDRTLGLTFQGLLRFSDCADRGDSYTFSPLEGDDPVDVPAEPPSVHCTQDACGQEAEIQLRYRLPARLQQDRMSRSNEIVDLPIRVTARLTPGVQRVDLEVTLNNRAKDHRLQVGFPLPFAVATAAYDGHFEIVNRPTEIRAGGPDWAEQPVMEQPVRAFVAASEGNRGLMIASRGLREGCVSPQGHIKLTLLRCFGWLSRNDLANRQGGAGPQLEVPGGQSPGEQTFHLSLIPFDGNLTSAFQEAENFLTPMSAYGTSLHPGNLPASGSLITVEPDCFAITAVKAAEGSDDMILRGVNLTDKDHLVSIGTLLPLHRAALARLDETEIGILDISSGNRIEIQTGPHEIVTLKLRFEDVRRQ